MKMENEKRNSQKSTEARSVSVNLYSLPAMPGRAAKVLRILRDQDANADQVELELRYDPGLTGNLLRLANSAFYGFPGEIGSVRLAVTRLGWNRVFQLVVASSVSGMLVEGVPGYGLEPGELWRHSLGVSVASEVLADDLEFPVPDEAFTAALLHDVGKLAVGRAVNANLPEIRAAVSRGRSFVEAEKEILGIDHAEAGAMVLEKWQFPASIIAAVRWHHDPDTAPEQNITQDIIHVADAVSGMLELEASVEEMEIPVAPGVNERLACDRIDLEAVAIRTLDGITQLTEVFGAMSAK
jgi:putative nucleotidyltransferase with HDIG domain